MTSVISTALTQTRFLDSPPIAEDLAGGAFDFGVMKEKVTTVYLILPANRLHTHSNWLRLMIVSILRDLMNTPRSAALPPPLLLLDEFAQLGYLPPIENAMGMVRGYGVQLIAHLRGPQPAQGPLHERWESFIANRGVLTAYAPQDLTTAKYLAEYSDQTTKTVETISESPEGEISVSRSAQGFPLFLPGDLMRLPRGRMLCFAEPVGYPFFIQAPGYWDTRFSRGLDPNPYAPQRS